MQQRESQVTVAIEVARTYRVVADYMAVKPGEIVVIVVDDRTSPSIWEALAAQTLAVAGDPVVAMMVPRRRRVDRLIQSLRRCHCEGGDRRRQPLHVPHRGEERGQGGGRARVFNAPATRTAGSTGTTADFRARKTAERLRDRLARGKIAHVSSRPAPTS
jgi:hypothetical protein